MSAWLFTAAGRAALTDGQNRATRAVTFTRLGVGDRGGAGEAGPISSRTTMRNRREWAALTGTAPVAGRIGLRAEWAPAAAYDVLETGVYARIGSGAEFLCLYWQGTSPLLRAASGTKSIIGGAIDLVAATAQVAVTIDPSISVAPPAGTFSALSDTPAAVRPGRYYRGGIAGSLEERTAAQILAEVMTASNYARGDGRGGVISRTPAQVAAHVAPSINLADLRDVHAIPAGQLVRRNVSGTAFVGQDIRSAVAGLSGTVSLSVSSEARGRSTSWTDVRAATIRTYGACTLLVLGTVYAESGAYRVRRTSPAAGTLWSVGLGDRHDADGDVQLTYPVAVALSIAAASNVTIKLQARRPSGDPAGQWGINSASISVIRFT